MASDEIFEIVDENNMVIGTAKRSECHGNPSLVHRTVHVIVYHPDGRILLQKRSAAKDVQPGRWDTAVGGHMMPGEDFETAARREMSEELGISDKIALRPVFDIKIRNSIEAENVKVFSAVHPGPFNFQKEEIDEVRFWSPAELEAVIRGKNDFTPNLVYELKKLFGHDV